MIGGDDTESAPLYLYIGEKNGVGDGSFLDRNGLKQGKLYVWVGDKGVDPQNFAGTGNTSAGRWVEVVNEGNGVGFLNGFATDSNLRAQADALGAFSFSRPEDVSINPSDGSQIVLASTGRSSLFNGADSWARRVVIEYLRCPLPKNCAPKQRSNGCSIITCNSNPRRGYLRWRTRRTV